MTVSSIECHYIGTLRSLSVWNFQFLSIMVLLFWAVANMTQKSKVNLAIQNT